MVHERTRVTLFPDSGDLTPLERHRTSRGLATSPVITRLSPENLHEESSEKANTQVGLPLGPKVNTGTAGSTMPGRALRLGVVDFFSGCGGVSTGFSLAAVPGANIDIVAGVDIDPNACATFERMHARPAVCLDIRQLLNEPDRLRTIVNEWNLDRFDRLVLVGCSPCQGFAAHRKAVDEDDPRRHLFTVFTEIARQLKPDAIFMENVPDLFSRKHWPHYAYGRQVLEEAGYTVRSRIYNLAGFGLPQERFRAIILAMKTSFRMPDPPLAPTGFVTVRDAIGHLPPLTAGEVCAIDPMHRTSNHRRSTIEILKSVPADGGNRPVGVGPNCLDRARAKHGGYTDVYGRLSWSRPSVTVTARCRTPSCGRFAHPEQNRGLSIREAALLQGFPPNFVFEGSFDDKFKQIGNAVPPLVARHFAEHLVRRIMGLRPTLQTSRDVDLKAPVGPGFAVTINGIKRRRGRHNKSVF